MPCFCCKPPGLSAVLSVRCLTTHFSTQENRAACVQLRHTHIRVRATYDKSVVQPTTHLDLLFFLIMGRRFAEQNRLCGCFSLLRGHGVPTKVDEATSSFTKLKPGDIPLYEPEMVPLRDLSRSGTSDRIDFKCVCVESLHEEGLLHRMQWIPHGLMSKRR